MIKAITFLSLLLGHLSFAFGQSTYAKEKSIQLSIPSISVDSIFFFKSAKVTLELREEGVQLFYTTDGSEVSKNSIRYSNPFIVTKTAQIKVKAFHHSYIASNTVASQVVKVNNYAKKAKIECDKKPKGNYVGNGIISLIDLKKGAKNFRKNNNWLGFQENEIIINLHLQKEEKINGVMVSFLTDYKSWIFGPAKVEVWSNDILLGVQDWKIPNEIKKQDLLYSNITFEQQNLKEIKIKVTSLPTIPNWHEAKGNLPWLFLDEIILN